MAAQPWCNGDGGAMQCNAMCCNTIRCNAMNKNAMQWKKVNKSGHSTPGAMVMVGAGHVSAQCQETRQPLHSCVSPALHFPCIVLHSIAVPSVRVARARAQALHFPFTFQTSLALHCFSQRQVREDPLMYFSIVFHCLPQVAIYVASQYLNAMF